MAGSTEGSTEILAKEERKCQPRKFQFSNARINALPIPSEGKRVYYTDSNPTHLKACVSYTGRRSWHVCKKVKGTAKPVMEPLGALPEMKYEQAKKAALEAALKLSTGVDTVSERKVEVAHVVILSTVISDYLKSRSPTRFKESTRQSYQGVLKRELGDWYNKPAANISRAMVKRRFLKISEKSETNANLTFRYLRAVMNFAIEEYRTENEEPVFKDNPVSVLKKMWHKVDARKRIIAKDDLKAWMEAVEGLDNSVHRDYLRFLIYTGCRREEAMSLRWNDVSLPNRRFTLRDPKNRQEVSLPISVPLLAILKERWTATSSMFVFPSGGGTGYMREPKKSIVAVTRECGVPFSSHDLRRTFATIASRVVGHYTVKRLLNHKISDQDVTGGYINPEDDELLMAADAVASVIQKTVSDAKRPMLSEV